MKLHIKLFIVCCLIGIMLSGCKFISKPRCSEDFMSRFQIALDEEDISFCKTFEKEGYTNIYDYPVCMLSSNEIFTPSDCVIAMAEKTQNILLCQEQKWFGRIHENHEMKCLSKIENLPNNIQWCDLLDPITKKYCISYVAIETNDLDLCESLDTIEYYGNDCITPLAIKRKNVQICDKHLTIGKGDLDRDFCIVEYAQTIQEYSVCKNIHDIDLKNRCQKKSNK